MYTLRSTITRYRLRRRFNHRSQQRRQSDRVMMDVQLELDRMNLMGTLPAPPSRPPSAPQSSTAPQTPAILPLMSDVELSEGETQPPKETIRQQKRPYEWKKREEGGGVEGGHKSVYGDAAFLKRTNELVRYSCFI